MVIESEPADSDLRQVVLRLGSFHTEMSFIGSIGHLIAESGLKELLELIYAPNAVEHILTGKAIARAVRAHLLVDVVLKSGCQRKPAKMLKMSTEGGQQPSSY